MSLKKFTELFGVGVALAILALGNQGEGGVAQPGCTVTVQPGQSIQAAIDAAKRGQ